MNRNENKKQARAEFVQQYVNEYRGKTECAVRELAEKLFISERTVWRDLTDTTVLTNQNNCNKK